MAGNPHQYAAGSPANEFGHHSYTHDRDQDRLDQVSISALIALFKLLDQWDREAGDHAEIM
jgi:hypothetical protein